MGSNIVITKERDDTGNWNVIVPDYASNQMASLQSTAAFGAASGINTVGSSTFTDGDGADSNDRVFYAFRSIQGYSKIGKYTGNSDSNGTFVYTGFKTAWVMVKKASAASTSWLIFDNKRPSYNGTGHRLYANATDTEDTGTGDSVDLVSNGFKFRGGSSSSNVSGATYIYMAFAEHPFVSSKGVPCTAR